MSEVASYENLNEFLDYETFKLIHPEKYLIE